VPIVHMQEYEIGDRSTVNYDFMKEKLGGTPIDGLIVHTAGFDDEGGAFRIIDVWETREHADRFMARMMEMVGSPEDLPRPETAVPPTRESHYELHDVVKG